MLNTIKLLFFIALITTSCKHDPFVYTGNPLNPNDTTNTPVDSCDPNIVYFNDVAGIFNGCAQSGCHDNVSHMDGINLTEYDSIVFYMLKPEKPTEWDETKLYEVLVKKANDPNKRMPPPPLDPLPQTEIALLKKWVEQGSTDEECYSLCDTTNILVTYNTHIINIMNSSCRVCHSGSSSAGNLDLTIPIAVSDNAELILSRMKLPEGDNSFMPQGGGKSQCNIKLVEKWINNGKPL